MSDRGSTGAEAYGSWIERVARKIPDPVIIFMVFLPATMIIAALMGGHEFESYGEGGEQVTYSIQNMFAPEHLRWLFDNAIVENWLAFGNGVLGIILVVMLGIGIAENAGFFAAFIKRIAQWVPAAFLPVILIFLGMLSSVATDAGYLVLIPLAGVLYAGLGRHPLIGMAAAFAGVSAGFSANLVPGSVDVIVGQTAQQFANAQGVPFENVLGQSLSPLLMNYWFIAISVPLLAVVGALVNRRYTQRRLAEDSWEVPEEEQVDEFRISSEEGRGLRATLWGVLVAAAIIAVLVIWPLAPYEGEGGQTIRPFVDNIIILIAIFFSVIGVFFGFAARRFRKAWDVVDAMTRQMNTLGYVMVLTFFCFNFLSVLDYSGLGAYITYLGSEALLALGVADIPILLIIGFVLITALINLFVGGLTSKWMLLGPIFIPMLYHTNPAMTPDLVAAAYRVADSSTNIITPMMTYAGVVLAFMRKYKPEMTFGDMLILMVPYSLWFLTVWTGLLVVFYLFGIPLGF